MARPIKDGVDYFPKDVDFYYDEKVRLLRAEFGCKGMYLLDYILCELYRNNGYFMRWDKGRCFLVSDGAGCGCTPEFVEEFVNGCIRCSFFDERVAVSFGILTSQGIQRRYLRMFNSRDFLYMEGAYFLLDINDKKDVPRSVIPKLALFYESTENPFKSTENPDKSTDNAQSKVKVNNLTYSKVKVTNVTQNRVKVNFITNTTTNTYMLNSEDEDVAEDNPVERFLSGDDDGYELNEDDINLFAKLNEIKRELGLNFDMHEFVVYNKARNWRGIGGENVLDSVNIYRYMKRWANGEERRQSKW